MKLSTKTLYGLRALIELCSKYDGESAVSIGDIARKQGLSETYLEQLFQKLRKAGLVKSVRGAQGGYMLSRPPEEISAASIVEALEGNIVFSECLEGAGCEKSSRCPTRRLWSKGKTSIDSILEETTLKDLAEDHALERFQGGPCTGGACEKLSEGKDVP